ncbi:hypothetical protein niasHS_010435 [Heterodera schachtii]|uniref:Uncharacterized protein n=1 Tax=Heterodera schachtii TaxID=97005 RepID=A0ABD2J1F9_HETSC
MTEWSYKFLSFSSACTISSFFVSSFTQYERNKIHFFNLLARVYSATANCSDMEKAQEQRQAERVEEMHEFQPPPPVIPEMPRFTEHEEEPQMFQEETVTKTQFYEMEGILHKQTGEILTFVEAIRQGLLNLSAGGEFFDIVSGQSVSLDKADPISLRDALAHGYIQFPSAQPLLALTLTDCIVDGFIDAHAGGLIQKSQTLTEVVENGLLDTQGHFGDRGNRFTLMEAINSGLLDEEIRHIALERRLLSPDGKIVLGWAEDGAHPERQIGVLQVQTERALDQAVRQTLLLSDASRQGLVDSALADILMAPCGLSEGGTEVSLIRAVSKGLVDASKGVVVDPRFQRELSVREAYDRGMFTSLRSAMHLAALLDVHPSLMTPVKKKPYSKKRIQRPGQPALAEDQVKVTLAEAMRQGLIDARTQRFRQGNQEMSLDDALHRGLIDPQSEWIVPSRASGIGPTIEERTQETVTETDQQLAPKIFRDKELQESVNTVKRVRRTEGEKLQNFPTLKIQLHTANIKMWCKSSGDGLSIGHVLLDIGAVASGKFDRGTAIPH